MTTTYTSHRGVQNLAKCLAALQVKPRTRTELCALLYMSKEAVVSYLRHLRASGQVYIHDWLDGDDGRIGTLCPVYAAGAAPDKRRPAKKTRQQISRDAAKRLEADPERKMAHLLARRAKKRKAKPDQSYLWLATARCEECGQVKARAQFFLHQKTCRACMHWTKKVKLKEAA